MELAGRTFSFPWENALMAWLQSHITGVAASVISQLSMFGEALVMILLIGLLYWCVNKQMGKYIGLNVLLVCVFCPMFKNVFLRRRPYFDSEEIHILRPPAEDADIYDLSAQGYSFPSGHSANSASAFGSAAVYSQKKQLPSRKLLTILAPILMLCVGFSRVFVGAHFPTDVLGGWCIGWLTIFVTGKLREKLNDPRKLYLLFLIIAIPGIFYCRSDDYFTGLGLLIGFMAGTLFEERYVRFEETRKPLIAVLRVTIGIAIYLAINTALKIPFSAALPAETSMSSYLARCVRYAIIAFLEFGIYPLSFRYLR